LGKYLDVREIRRGKRETSEKISIKVERGYGK
jgi:hypothetical protein